MEIRIKHGDHELEIKGEQRFIEEQLEKFYATMENYEKMIREPDRNDQCTGGK